MIEANLESVDQRLDLAPSEVQPDEIYDPGSTMTYVNACMAYVNSHRVFQRRLLLSSMLIMHACMHISLSMV